MLPHRTRTAALLLVAPIILTSSSLPAADENPPIPETAARFLPESTAVYAELTRPAELLRTVLDHEITHRIRETPEFKQATASPKFIGLRFLLGVMEKQIGMTWREAAAAMTEGGIHAAFDPDTQGAALLIRTRDAETLNKVRDAFFQFARDEAGKKGNDSPVEEREYRGVPVFKLGKAKVATIGPWLIAVSSEELGQSILDRYLDGRNDSLEANPRMSAAKKFLTGSPSGWIWADVERLRASGAAKQLYRDKSDNPLLELLLGGFNGTLQKTPFVLGTLDVTPSHLDLSLKSPHDPAWVGSAREYFFGPDGRGAAPAPLELAGTVLSLNAYRDFSGMWLNAGDIFVDKIDAGLAEANANLSTLFAGKDFGEDILGSFRPEVQIVAVRQSFEGKETIPAIKLPAFAVVFRFRDDAEQNARDFRRMYQNLIGFINITGAMNGNPQMNLGEETVAGHKLLTATFMRDELDPPDAASIHHNFSPSVAFVNDYFAVASTKELGRRLIEKLSTSGGDDRPTSPDNTFASLEFASLTKILDDNRGQLVARNMLSEGSSREQAEKHVDLILQGLSLLQRLTFRLSAHDGVAGISLDLQFSDANPR